MAMEKIGTYLKTTATTSHWNKIGIRSHHGICLPLASLHSQNSCSIGDFGDLVLLIQWCREVGFDCIQLLPLNDTGDDPSPYNPLSSCALDPIYINLQELPHFHELAPELPIFTPIGGKDRLSHYEIKRLKIEWLLKYFKKNFADLQWSKEYQHFIQQNSWLHTYALFKSCKENFEGRHWQDWPPEHQSHESCTVDIQQIHFNSFLQFHAFRQLEKAKKGG